MFASMLGLLVLLAGVALLLKSSSVSLALVRDNAATFGSILVSLGLEGAGIFTIVSGAAVVLR